MRVVIDSMRSYRKPKPVNKKIYMIVAIMVLLLGVYMGCFLASNIGKNIVNDFKSYLNAFELKDDLSKIFTFNTLSKNIFENSKYIILIWLFGFSKYLIFGTLVINFYKGFIDSFATYFLISKFGMNGIKLALLPLIGYKLFYIYLVIFISSSSLGFALNFNKKVCLKDKDFRKYLLHIFVAFAVICAISVIETFSTPYILKEVIK